MWPQVTFSLKTRNKIASGHQMCLQSIMKKKKTWSPFRFLWIPRKGKTLGGCQGAIPIENEKKTI
jgi:hypothetical protein